MGRRALRRAHPLYWSDLEVLGEEVALAHLLEEVQELLLAAAQDGVGVTAAEVELDDATTTRVDQPEVEADRVVRPPVLPVGGRIARILHLGVAADVVVPRAGVDGEGVGAECAVGLGEDLHAIVGQLDADRGRHI